jgi:hypothetical protein
LNYPKESDVAWGSARFIAEQEREARVELRAQGSRICQTYLARRLDVVEYWTFATPYWSWVERNAKTEQKDGACASVQSQRDALQASVR